MEAAAADLSIRTRAVSAATAALYSTVQVHRLLRSVRYSRVSSVRPKQGVRGVSGRGRNRSVRTLKRCSGRSAELFERYIFGSI